MAFRGNQYAEGSSANRRPPRKRDKWPGIIFGGLCGVAVIIVIVIEASHGGTSSSAATTATATGTPSAQTAAIAACQARKPTGEIYVRTVDPGASTLAQQLGGAWQWDYTTGKCLDSVDFATATAGTAPGECTTVGYVADNPGYNPNATDPAPIRHLAGEAGPGC